MISFGTTEIKDLRLGSTQPKAVYFGDELVWQHEEPGPVEVNALKFTAEQANSTISLNKVGSPASVSLEKSTDGVTWSAYTVGDTVTLANVGDEVYLRAVSSNANFGTSNRNYYKFALTGKVAADGGLSYLLNKDGADVIPNHCFRSLFTGQTALTKAPAIDVLSATGSDCCNEMFRGCTSLTEPPRLDATNLGMGAWFGLLQDCTSLTAAPVLSATQLDSFSYGALLMGCTALSSAPSVLPARQLYNSTYNSMFKNCTNVREIPTLHLTGLTMNCFQDFLNGSGVTSWTVDMTECTSVPSLPQTTLFSASGVDNYTILVPASLYDSWIAANNWNAISSHIRGAYPSNTYVKYSDSSVSSFDIVGELGENVIPNGNSVQSIEIGSNVTSIGAYAFNGFEQLQNVTIPSTVTSIGEEAFYDCTENLEDIWMTDRTMSEVRGMSNYPWYLDYLGFASIHCSDGMLDPTTPPL